MITWSWAWLNDRCTFDLDQVELGDQPEPIRRQRHRTRMDRVVGVDRIGRRQLACGTVYPAVNAAALDGVGRFRSLALHPFEIGQARTILELVDHPRRHIGWSARNGGGGSESSGSTSIGNRNDDRGATYAIFAHHGAFGEVALASGTYREHYRPISAPHLGFAPMAFLGSRYADGTVFGFALIFPRSSNLLADTAFQQAIREIMPWNDETSRRELTLKGGELRLLLTLVGETPRRSLDITPYVSSARTWATCTRVVLDRHLKETANEARQIEIESLLRRACANIGLPEAERVVADKHSAVEGSPSAYPSS
jgi:hypothetical protein